MSMIGVAGLALITLLPAAGHVLTSSPLISQNENRYLAAFPKHAENLRDYTAKVDRYVNDNFGFRHEAIKAERKIRRSLGDGGGSVYPGRDGWLFWSESLIWDSYLGRSNFSEHTLERLNSHLSRLNTRSAQIGAHFMATIVPNKVSIYPEYSPHRFGEKSERNFHDYFFKQDHAAGYPVVNLKPVLLNLKKTDQVYFKTDTHWTWRGAFEANAHIINRLSKTMPEITALTAEKLPENHTPEFRGDLSKFMAQNPSEDLYDIEVPDVPGFLRDVKGDESLPAEWKTQIHQRAVENPKTIVIIGDSFSLFYVKPLKHSFDKIVIIHHKLGDYSVDEVFSYNPDVVLFSPVERYVELVASKRDLEKP